MSPSIKALVFDFDGTIVLSNNIKKESYFETAINIIGHYELLHDCIDSVKGDRKKIFELFLIKNNIDIKYLDHFVDVYSQMVEKKIIKLKLVDDVDTLLSLANKRNINCYINTATPLNAIKIILKKMKIDKYFTDVYGGYGMKVSNLQKIINKTGYDKSSIKVIGDGVDDMISAQICGLDFIAVGNNQELNSFSKLNYKNIIEMIN